MKLGNHEYINIQKDYEGHEIVVFCNFSRLEVDSDVAKEIDIWLKVYFLFLIHHYIFDF